jgi:hypothetical protein
MTIYLTCERSYRLQGSLNHIKENAGLVAFILKTEIKKSGHIGCSRLTDDFSLINFPPYTITTQNKLMGTGQELTVRYADFPNASLVKTSQIKDVIYTTNNLTFKPGNILIISDCHHAEIVKVKKANHFQDRQQIMITSPLHTIFSQGAEVSRLVINRYFIGKINNKTFNKDHNYSLFEENILKQKRELVSDVNQMQFLYSTIEDGMMVDLPFESINDWSKVVGISIKFNVQDHQLKKDWYLYVAVNN